MSINGVTGRLCPITIVSLMQGKTYPCPLTADAEKSYASGSGLHKLEYGIPPIYGISMK